YHRPDCPRLHFGRAVALAEARARFKPCPLCMGASASLAPPTSAEGVATPTALPPRAAAAGAPVRPAPLPASAEPAAIPPADASRPVPAPRAKHHASRGHRAAIGALIGSGGG